MTYKIEKRFLEYPGKIGERVLITGIPSEKLADDIVALLEDELDIKPFDDTKLLVLAE